MINKNLTNKLAWSLCFALCIQRLSMALGSISWGIAILLFLILIYKTQKNDGKLIIGEEIRGYYTAYAICALASIPSIFVAVDISGGIKLFLEMWVYRVMPFFMVTLFIKDTNLLKKLVLVFLAVLNIDCLVALGQVVLNLAPRGWGFGGNTLHLASMLCVVIPMLLVVIWDKAFSDKEKRFALISIVCCCIGAIAGQSRGTWLTLAIVLPLLSIKYVINSSKKMFAMVAVCFVIVGIFMSSPRLMHRVESISNVTTDRSNTCRLAVWQSGINMMMDHPVFGIGLGGFSEAYKTKYILPEDTIKLSHAHNNLLQIGAETGLVGLLGFVYLNGYILIKTFFDWRKDYSPYSLMLLSGWLGFVIFGMFDLTIDASAVMKTLWFLLGTLLVFKNSKNNV